MKILTFDVETTGLAPRYTDIAHTHRFPYVVQLSWLVYDTGANKVSSINDYLIKLPDGVKIPEESTEIHGITNNMMKGGKDIRRVLIKFANDYANCKIIVAHNINFDKKMMDVEFYREGMIGYLDKFRKKMFCTMQSSKTFCNLTMISKYTGKTMLKWPKLCELHDKLFGEIMSNTHNALVDILMCFRCYYKLENSIDIIDVNRKFKLLFENTCNLKTKN